LRQKQQIFLLPTNLYFALNLQFLVSKLSIFREIKSGTKSTTIKVTFTLEGVKAPL
jgi:hypothetical protein